MKVRYTLPALADLSTVLEYLAALSPRGSRRVQARIQAVIDVLLLHPHIGTRTDEPTIRKITTAPYPYIVFYEAADNEIIIHAIRHDTRDPSGMPGTA